MPNIKLNLYATLRTHVGGKPSVEVEIEPGETLGQVLTRLGIPHEHTRILFVNNRAAGLGDALHADDQVGVFPAIGGG
jgi:molybdopterin converting factor small subunit